jgi:hypothetical protein
MSESRTAADEEVTILAGAVAAWIVHGQSRPLDRWLARAIDFEGMPRRLPVADWPACLAALAEARRGRGAGWPDLFDAWIERFFRQALRFSRPDGSPAFGGPVGAVRPRDLFRYWAEQLPDPGLAIVVDRWFPSRTKGRARGHAAPPPPSTAGANRPLMVLRADWSREGDFLAIDHRAPGGSCLAVLFGLGRAWLGPSWASGVEGTSAGHPRPALRVSNESAELAEWSFRVGSCRILRTALLLRGRRLALLADQVEGPGPTPAMRVAMAEGVAAAPLPESRGVSLTPARGRGSAQVLPLGLPCLPYPTDRGAFSGEAGSLDLGQAQEGRRCWLPLLVSWDPLRRRMPVRWRVLTVSEGSKACPPETAFAARVTWGRDETLVIYRSLGRPATRAFLGHQTRARFLVGLFNREGNVEPIVKVEG